MSDSPEGPGAAKTFYERLNGAEGVRALVDRFYDLMDTLPEAKALRALHPPSLEESREKLYEFLCGWLGGPPLYMQKRGHPRLRARHLPFVIDDAGVDMWLHCMFLSLEEHEALRDDRDAVEKLKGGLAPLARHMKNAG
jgi:hemoglobin